MEEEKWDDSFAYVGRGVSFDDDSELHCLTSLVLNDDIEQDTFDEEPGVSLRRRLIGKGWIFEYDEDNEQYNLPKKKPVAEIDFATPTWKKELKKCYEQSLVDLTETILDNKTWIPD